MDLKTLATYKTRKLLVGVNDKGRTPDPGSEYDMKYLTGRLIYEAIEELLPEIEVLMAKFDGLPEEETSQQFETVMLELADVSNFVDFIDQSIRLAYERYLWRVAN